MRVVFAGTPPFAARALEAILASGFDVPLVLTQPDRPAGRGLRLASSAVAQSAASRGIAIAKPASLRDSQVLQTLRNAAPDVLVVAAYGLMLPQAVLDLPPFGCLNIHASLLPRWRGAAPIQRAILAGDPVTGVTIMRMDAGLDTGPLLLARSVPIGARETAGTLTDLLAQVGASAAVDTLRDLAAFDPHPQDDGAATYAAKIAKQEARIDWDASSVAIDRLVRALDPVPGAEARLGDESLKIWEAEAVAGSGPAGQVLAASEEGLHVACGKGALRITAVQRPGGRRMPIGAFLRGKAVAPGDHIA